MARYCRQCNRPLDAEHHDVTRAGPLKPAPFAGFVQGRRVQTAESFDRSDAHPLVRHYSCRVDFRATTPDGVELDMDPRMHRQRVTELNQRFVYKGDRT